MKTKILLALVASTLTAFAADSLAAEKENKYLAFQIFTHYTPDPKDAQALSNGMKERLTPGTAAMRN